MANNHYETIALLNNPADRHIEEEVTIESPHPNILEQPISLDDADDVIDLTDDSETTAIQQPDSVQYDTSNNELQFPTHSFVSTAAEWVDDLPHDIDVLKLYKIKCSRREWVQKSQDLRYFKKHSSSRNKEVWKVIQNIPYKVRWLILMAVIHNELDIKTLALFIYHPAMQCILRLATMEVKMSPHMK